MNEPDRINLNVSVERWPLAAAFAISRGSKTEAEVVVAELFCAGLRGRGECVPYGRYGETVAGVTAAIEAMAPALRQGLTRDDLQQAMGPGAARNALDCALWDLDARRAGTSVAALAGLGALKPVTTAYTLSLDTAEAMAAAAARAAARPLIKVKLGSRDGGDGARIAAVRRAAPAAELIVDANEGWRADDVAANIAACAAVGVTMIEQPLPADDDALLVSLERPAVAAMGHTIGQATFAGARVAARPISLCADESVHGRDGLRLLASKYDMVNIKLDKTGGLTEALALAAAAKAQGFAIMVGSMVGTSLAVAPALLLAQSARIVDLDGPLLLARDRDDGLRVEGSVLYPPEKELWG